MGKMKFILILAMAASIFTTPVQAGLYSGADLQKLCAAYVVSGGSTQSTNSQNAIDAMQCYNYIAGVVDDSILSLEHPRFCPPDESTLRQFVLVVFEYLDNRPEALHKSGNVLVRGALNGAFPCNGSAQ